MTNQKNKTLYVVTQDKEMDNIMQFAIEKNRPRFVEWFLEQGFDLNNFLKECRILELYRKVCLLCHN